MKSQILAIVLLGVALLAGSAQANVVNFDNFAGGVTITNQYADVVFSAGGGDVIMTLAQNPPFRGSAPNLMCTGLAGVADCAQDVILSFTTPVDNLTFNAFGNQTSFGGTFAQADVYQLGVLTHANVALLVSHVPDGTCGIYQGRLIDCNPDPQSLAYLGITQIIIHNNVDSAGTAYDDFSFTPESDPASVPEPSTLLLTGLCGIFWAGRRFLARKSM